MGKAAEAFRTISEVAGELNVQKHVLRFWEARFPQVRPMKRGGGRRYYRPEDMELLRGIRHLLHAEGYTIKGVQKILREQGIDHVKQYGRVTAVAPQSGVQGKRTRAAGGGRPLPAAGPPTPPRAAGQEPIRLANRPVAQKAANVPEGRALLAAAIGELEACRKLLLDPLAKAHGARGGGGGPRRARLVGA